MDDPKKLLDGPVEDVKTRMVDLSNDDLLKLRAAEQAGQKRTDVLNAIEGAISASDMARAGGTEKVVVGGALTSAAFAGSLDTSGPAKIDAATTFSTSGAPVQLVPDVDPSHPAVDNDPRKNTTVDMNRIDFNDPTISGPEAAAKMLEKQKLASTTASGDKTTS